MLKALLKRRIATAFDKWSFTYSNDVAPKLERRGYSYSELARLISSRLTLNLNEMALELGVGTGILGKEMVQLKTGLRVLGVDISKCMLQQAREQKVYFGLLQCDVEYNIPMRDNTITNIYSAFMAHSIINLYAFFKELKRVLKKDSGVIIVDLFRTKRRLPFISKIHDNIHSFQYEHGAFSNYYTVKEFANIAKRAGFKVVEMALLDTNENVAKASAGEMGHYLLKLSLDQ